MESCLSGYFRVQVRTIRATELTQEQESGWVATALRIVGYLTANIEDLQEGDLIVSRDQHDPQGPLVGSVIGRKYKRRADHLQLLRLAGERGRTQLLQTTEEHPFCTEGGQWTSARALRPGQGVRAIGDGFASVVANVRQPHPGGVVVYNMEVEGTHTYFVQERSEGAGPVWVHNASYSGEQGRDASGRWLPKDGSELPPGAFLVDDFIANAQENGMVVAGRNVAVRTPFGDREIDVVLRDLVTGDLHGVEIKSSESAFTRFDEPARQQFAGDRYINQHGAEVIGQWREQGLTRITSSAKILWNGGTQ